MSKDKHLERIKAIKRASRIELGGIGGRGGTHADKKDRRMRHMGTKDWLEETEEDIPKFYDDFELGMPEDDDDAIVTCSMCGGQVSADTAHLHQDQWIGDECCWDERLKTTE